MPMYHKIVQTEPGTVSRTAATTLSPAPPAAGLARTFTAATLNIWGLACLVDGVNLAVTELVTNAVLHARTTMRLTLTLADGRLRVDVQDYSPALPVRSDPGLDATGGRGLLLVEALAEAWGVDLRGPGKVVWFTWLTP